MGSAPGLMLNVMLYSSDPFNNLRGIKALLNDHENKLSYLAENIVHPRFPLIYLNIDKKELKPACHCID